MMFPPLPPWEGTHVLIVHFPIGLLLVAPLFAVLAALFPARARWASWTTLILLALGTTGAFVAVESGVAARDLVEEGPDEMFEVLEQHEELALSARVLFAVVTAVYASLLALPLLWKTLSRVSLALPAHLLFVVGLLGANLLLANTAHLGGRLVHEYGVRADLGVETAAPERPADEAEEDA